MKIKAIDLVHGALSQCRAVISFVFCGSLVVSTSWFQASGRFVDIGGEADLSGGAFDPDRG